MRHLAFAIIAVFGLTSCTTEQLARFSEYAAQQRARQEQEAATARARAEAEERARIEALAAEDDTVCRSYGLAFGTPSYADCRQGRDQQRTAIQMERERRALALQQEYIRQRVAEKQLQSQERQAIFDRRPSQTTTTNCHYIGQYLSCTTN